MSLTLFQWLLIGVLLIVIGIRQPRGAIMIALSVASIGLLLGFQNGALPSLGDLQRWAAIETSSSVSEPRAADSTKGYSPRTSKSDRSTDIGKTSRLPEETGQGEAEFDRQGLAGRPPIHGRNAFRAAVSEILDDFADNASSDLRGIIAHINSIRELTRDGGNVLAFVETPGCRISVYPRGWQTSRVMRARVIAHEAYHCWLESQGRAHESRHHIGFEPFERRVAAELYGSRAAGADFYQWSEEY